MAKLVPTQYGPNGKSCVEAAQTDMLRPGKLNKIG